MPRKTKLCGFAKLLYGRFNEAAARCRGKRPQRMPLGGGVNASMRPRPDAAENILFLIRLIRIRIASMRPRPDAAENAREDPNRTDPTATASMRPRPDAAENQEVLAFVRQPPTGFNEAAARCRGKRDPPS